MRARYDTLSRQHAAVRFLPHPAYCEWLAERSGKQAEAIQRHGFTIMTPASTPRTTLRAAALLDKDPQALQLAVLPAESKECYDEAYLISQLAGGPGGKLSHSLFYEPRVSGNIVRYALARQLRTSLLAIWDRINETKEPEHFKVADYNDHNYGEGVLKNQQEAGIEVDVPGILPEDILCRRRMLDMLFPSIYLEPTNADNLVRGIKEAYQEASFVNMRVR